jgi:hypothetical protein
MEKAGLGRFGGRSQRVIVEISLCMEGHGQCLLDATVSNQMQDLAWRYMQLKSCR